MKYIGILLYTAIALFFFRGSIGTGNWYIGMMISSLFFIRMVFILSSAISRWAVSILLIIIFVYFALLNNTGHLRIERCHHYTDSVETSILPYVYLPKWYEKLIGWPPPQ